ncbi:hypothetical protein JMJ77_0006033, partial [Colletotrichum scovillei]
SPVLPTARRLLCVKLGPKSTPSLLDSLAGQYSELRNFVVQA